MEGHFLNNFMPKFPFLIFFIDVIISSSVTINMQISKHQVRRKKNNRKRYAIFVFLDLRKTKKISYKDVYFLFVWDFFFWGGIRGGMWVRGVDKVPKYEMS